MPGEWDEMVGAYERFKKFEAELRRTSDAKDRAIVNSRVDEAKADWQQKARAFKAAAEAGDTESSEIMRMLT